MAKRSAAEMTTSEVAAFLDGQRDMVLATLGSAGEPHLVAMWFVVLDGCVAFWSFARSQKVVNLRRDPRLTVLVESGVGYAELCGVQISGRARLVEREAEVLGIGRAIAERYRDRLPAGAAEAMMAQAHKRVGVIVEPSRVVSWDHSKLG